VMQGVVEVLRLVTSPGDAVVVNPPAYPPFYGFVEHADRRVVEAPLTPEHRPDPDALRAAFAEATAGGRPAAYLLCHPHNPTGAVYRESELATIAELAAAYRVRVVVDEIHAPLVLPGSEFRPYLSLPGTEDAFAIYSASKGWNLAGLKAAVVVAGEVAAADLARLPEEVSHGPSHIGVLAHTAALREGGAWLDAVLAGLDRNRKLLGDLLADRLPAIRWLPPEGTYFAWLDCRGLDLPTSGTPGGRGVITSLAGPAGVFLERGRVALSDGPAFGTGGAGHVRLNMATTPEILGVAIDRMARAVTG
jgi:cystathionine beta-lyase